MSSPVAPTNALPAASETAEPRRRLPASLLFFAFLVAALFATEAAFFAVAFSLPNDRLEIPASR